MQWRTKILNDLMYQAEQWNLDDEQKAHVQMFQRIYTLDSKLRNKIYKAWWDYSKGKNDELINDYMQNYATPEEKDQIEKYLQWDNNTIDFLKEKAKWDFRDFVEKPLAEYSKDDTFLDILRKIPQNIPASWVRLVTWLYDILLNPIDTASWIWKAVVWTPEAIWPFNRSWISWYSKTKMAKIQKSCFHFSSGRWCL